MKSGPATISLLLTAVLLVSCGEDSSPSQPVDVDSHSVHAGAASGSTSLEEIELNDGQKWEMDEHTRASFASMAGSFLEVDPLSLGEEGLKNAGAGLQADINELIQGCTMTGAAHDQLHVFLMGYIPAVADLSESGRGEDAEKVKHYLGQYGDYFE